MTLEVLGPDGQPAQGKGAPIAPKLPSAEEMEKMRLEIEAVAEDEAVDVIATAAIVAMWLNAWAKHRLSNLPGHGLPAKKTYYNSLMLELVDPQQGVVKEFSAGQMLSTLLKLVPMLTDVIELPAEPAPTSEPTGDGDAADAPNTPYPKPETTDGK